MNRINLHVFAVLCMLSALLIGISSCDKDDNGNNNNSFDRVSLLENFADNIIQPNFADLQTEVDELVNAVNAFTGTPTQQNLTNLQNEWKDAILAYQYVNAFNFGPADGFLGTVTQRLATFPVDTTTLEGYIDAADFTLDNLNRDTRGLLGMEYLVFDKAGDDNVVLARYTQAGDAGNRSTYLSAIAADVKQIVDDVVANWPAYRATFIAQDGTDAGSSTSDLFNSFSLSYESIKNFKVGLPLGTRPGQTQAEPQLTEAYYSSSSVELIKVHFDAVLDVYYGRSKAATDNTGIGFDDYLRSATGGEQLVTDTEAQILLVQNALDNLPNNTALSDLIANDEDSVNDLFTELQKLTRFFKSDMSSLLGISITFDSGDGD